ncbi:MAG TPA: pilus assembly protein PilB, partial [Nitrospira sp.]|nr:pilus assembly protein PilB [Nitrospira sp.]
MSRSLARPNLTEILVSQGVLTRPEVEEVLRRVKGVPAALGKALIDDRLLSEDQLAQALASQYGL